MGILFINGGEIGGNTAHLGHAFLEGRDFTQIDLAGKRLFFLFRGGAPTQQMYERGEYTINRFAGLYGMDYMLSLIHISEPTRRVVISYAVFCLKKIFFNDTATTEIYTRLFVGSVRCV